MLLEIYTIGVVFAFGSMLIYFALRQTLCGFWVFDLLYACFLACFSWITVIICMERPVKRIIFIYNLVIRPEELERLAHKRMMKYLAAEAVKSGRTGHKPKKPGFIVKPINAWELLKSVRCFSEN